MTGRDSASLRVSWLGRDTKCVIASGAFFLHSQGLRGGRCGEAIRAPTISMTKTLEQLNPREKRARFPCGKVMSSGDEHPANAFR
jgi:hypothetical protein